MMSVLVRIPLRSNQKREKMEIEPTKITISDVEEVSDFEPLFEYLSCYVTIWNNSSEALTNLVKTNEWGKYMSDPLSNQAPKSWQDFRLAGRDSAWSGCEGSATYRVSYQPGAGSVKFYYTCPYSGDNAATVTNDSFTLKTSVYAAISKKSGESGWGTDKSKWGKEGQVPKSGHPVAILFYIEDA